MYDFIERPMFVRDEYPMLRKHPSRLVVQTGLQPVAFVQEDVQEWGRPQSLLRSLFHKSKRAG